MPQNIVDLILALVTMVLGVAGSFGLYWLLDKAIQLFPIKIQDKIKVLGFITPAAVLVITILALPLVQTVVWSFMDKPAKKFVGVDNYIKLFGSADFLGILLNNFLWLAIVPAVTIALGTLFAQLSNQVGPTREKIFKSVIFLPMTISFVAASTVWKYFYYAPLPGRPEIGLLNAIYKGLTGATESVIWLQVDTARLNSLLLMIVLIWLQVGYSMTIISAGIKAVPEETIEAARVDGATGIQIFFRVIVPQIAATLMSVFVTVLITVMKVFDIILAMTGGGFNTNVLALEYYRQFFVDSALGPASAVVTILLVLIAPLMWAQIRTVRHQESLR
ncbi:MAG: carbohydrate ABC transporter permease [Micrococcales bacterium]